MADDGLRQAYAFIRQVVSQGSDITSGTTITPPSTGYAFDITGTTAITTIASTESWDGRLISLQFDGALTLTHSSNLYLPGAANITTVAGDIALFEQRGTGAWQCISYSNKANILRVGGSAITNTNGNWSIPAPGSGLSLNVTGIANASIVALNDGTRTVGIGTDSVNSTGFIGTTSAHGFDVYAGGSQRVRFGSAGNVTINAPSSGNALTVSGYVAIADTYQLIWGAGTTVIQGSSAANTLSFWTTSLSRLAISAAGNVTIAAPSSGLTLVLDNQVGGAAAVNDVARIYTGSSSTATPRLLFGSLANADAGAIGVQTTSGTAGTMRFYTDRAGTLTEAMSINDAGNVAIAAPSSGYGLNIPTGTPASAAAAGTAGDIAWDASYIYVCTATNTWKRATLASW